MPQACGWTWMLWGTVPSPCPSQEEVAIPRSPPRPEPACTFWYPCNAGGLLGSGSERVAQVGQGQGLPDPSLYRHTHICTRTIFLAHWPPVGFLRVFTSFEAPSYLVRLGIVHSYNHSIRNAEVGGPRVQGQAVFHLEYH